MTMLVLSPSVEAMKTSARSIPAAVSASISSAGADREVAAEVLPGLVEPDLEPRVRLGVLVEAGDLMALARASRGRPRSRPGPQPTIRTNMRRILVAAAPRLLGDRQRGLAADRLLGRRRRAIRPWCGASRRSAARSAAPGREPSQHVLGHRRRSPPASRRRSRRGRRRRGSWSAARPPMTIASTPRSRAASTIPAPTLRARTTVG